MKNTTIDYLDNKLPDNANELIDECDNPFFLSKTSYKMREDLLDKTLKKLCNHPDGIYLVPYLKECSKDVDSILIDSICDELIERNWVKKWSGFSYPIKITQEGKDIYEIYGSYTGFKRALDKEERRKATRNNFRFRLEIMSGIFVIISVIATIYSTYVGNQNDKKNDTLQAEMNMLKVTIDSLKTQVNTRSEKMVIIQRSDSVKTNSNVDRHPKFYREAGDIPKATDRATTVPNGTAKP